MGIRQKGRHDFQPLFWGRRSCCTKALGVGMNRSAIGTLVERSSRLTMLVHLRREEGCGLLPWAKNGPALASYGLLDWPAH